MRLLSNTGHLEHLHLGGPRLVNQEIEQNGADQCAVSSGGGIWALLMYVYILYAGITPSIS